MHNNSVNRAMRWSLLDHIESQMMMIASERGEAGIMEERDPGARLYRRLSREARFIYTQPDLLFER